MTIKIANRRAALLHSGAALAAVLASAPALAAEEAAASAEYSDAGEAIVVTARRREESSQDVPIALSVVSARTLEKTGNFTLNQVQQLVPSLQVTASNPRNSNINIRGLGANSAVAAGDGLEYGVGFYLDGVYYGRPGQSAFDLIDLAQIEVLRGPQGTLFGKNTTAGALNITTREPSFDPELTVEGSLGDYKYHQIRASGSVPIVADKIAVRLSVADTHRDGFLTNLFTGKDAQNYDNFTARGQILIKPNDDLKIRLIGDYSKQTLASIFNSFDGYFTTFANGAPITNNIVERAARFGLALPVGTTFRRTGSSNSPYQSNSKSYGASAGVDWDLGRATLTSVTAYRWWDWYPKNDVDGSPLSIQTRGQQENFQRQFSQEFRVASNGENTLDYVFGLFYYWQKVRGYGQTQYGADYARWNNPATTPAATLALLERGLTNLQANSFSDPQTKSYAAFGQVDWHITDALTLTGGLRYTHENKDGEFRRFLAPDSGGDRSLLTPAQQAANQVSDVFFTAKLKDNAVSGLATLSYKVTPDVLIYGSYSRGSKSGGLNLTAGGLTRTVSDPSKLGTVEPEKVNAFELGLKSQLFDGDLTFNLAAFLTEITDYQANVTEASGATTIQYIANIPKVRSKGIEADLSYALNEWISLTAAGAYTDATFVRYTNAPQAPERANLGATQDLSGVRLTGVSKFAYTLGADVTQPLNDKIEIYARGDWLHRSSFNASPVNSVYGIVPAYGVLNARVGVRGSDGKIDLAFWARNLLDKNYYVSRSPGQGITAGLVSATPADPRTVGATLRVKW